MTSAPARPQPEPCATCGRHPAPFGYHVDKQPPRYYCTDHRGDGERWLKESRQAERSSRW